MAQPARTWFDEEAPLAVSGRLVTSRLGRRALFSWPRLVIISVLIASGVTVWRSRIPPTYGVTVVLHVSDSVNQPASGSDLGLGALHAYLNDRVFTTARLLALMARHPASFPKLEKDPTLALADLRDSLEIEISDNDFIEERGSGDPPRSARIGLEYRASTPEKAWLVSHALADLLIDSTRARERMLLEQEEGATALTLKRAQADLQELSRATGAMPAELTLVMARERMRIAERAHAAAQIAVRAAADQQALRLDMVDPGHQPEPINQTVALTTAFLLTFFITLATLFLLVGAFDPRVLDSDDLTSLGVTLLGHTSPLPARPPVGEGLARGRRAPRV